MILRDVAFFYAYPLRAFGTEGSHQIEMSSGTQIATVEQRSGGPRFWNRPANSSVTLLAVLIISASRNPSSTFLHVTPK